VYENYRSIPYTHYRLNAQSDCFTVSACPPNGKVPRYLKKFIRIIIMVAEAIIFVTEPRATLAETMTAKVKLSLLTVMKKSIDWNPEVQ